LNSGEGAEIFRFQIAHTYMDVSKLSSGKQDGVGSIPAEA
jgi:hypothetical protein